MLPRIIAVSGGGQEEWATFQEKMAASWKKKKRSHMLYGGKQCAIFFVGSTLDISFPTKWSIKPGPYVCEAIWWGFLNAAVGEWKLGLC